MLALDGDNGYTYAVPLSFVYADGKIYFHAALSGHKLDAIKNNDKVSFCVVSQDDKYSPDIDSESREKEINGKMKALVVIVIEIEHLTGKAARELVK